MKMNFHKTPTIREEPLYTYDTEPSNVDEDISPFETYASNVSFALYLEPILNSYYKTYQNIITLNTIPPGPLGKMVVQINVPKLSEFQSVSTNVLDLPPSRNGGRCIYALMRYPKGSRLQTVKNANMYMSANDIPAVYGYLKANGYTIDTSLTKMTFQSQVKLGSIHANGYSGNRKLICMVDAIL